MRILPVLALVVLAGCRFGSVNQGQVIDYQRSAGTVTLIQDSNYQDPKHPKFDILPPVTIRVPSDPQEMGPEPVPGKLLRVDEANHTLQVFNAQPQAVETIPYREGKMLTITAGHKTMAVAVDERYLSLPPDTWKSGDMVRYYYKEQGQALRLMNVTKTKLE